MNKIVSFSIILTCSLLLFTLLFDKNRNIEAQNFNTSKIDSFFTILSKKGELKGVVSIVYNNYPVYEKGFGTTSDKGETFSTKTQINIASITKQFAAVIILQLVEQQKLSLENTLDIYFDKLPKEYRKINIFNLLTHTSGIPDYFANGEIFKLAKSTNRLYSKADLLAICLKHRLESNPGTKFNYSNPNYFLLGLIIEKVEKKPLRNVLMERVLMPAELYNTDCCKEANNWDNATSCLYSTVDDLKKWAKALTCSSLLNETSSEIMKTPYLNNYAMGLYIKEVAISEQRKTTLAYHYGITARYKIIIEQYLQENLNVIIYNEAQPNKLEEIVDELRRLIFLQKII